MGITGIVSEGGVGDVELRSAAGESTAIAFGIVTFNDTINYNNVAFALRENRTTRNTRAVIVNFY